MPTKMSALRGDPPPSSVVFCDTQISQLWNAFAGFLEAKYPHNNIADLALETHRGYRLRIPVSFLDAGYFALSVPLQCRDDLYLSLLRLAQQVVGCSP